MFGRFGDVSRVGRRYQNTRRYSQWRIMERNIQNGLKEMLNGVTHMVRNVTAHELKIKWVVNEQ